MQNQKSTQTILLSYFSYLALFVGTGFISGSIVHSGNIAEIPKYIIIGIIGVSMFVTGSFVQEFVINKGNLSGLLALQFFATSLLLSIGIGMISGGTQHYSDFPIYSSYLIPLGLILSLLAFLFKNKFVLPPKTLITVLVGFGLVALITHFGLMGYANSLVKNKIDNCKIGNSLGGIIVFASEGHAETDCKTTLKQNQLISEIDHKSMSQLSEVKDDKTFIEYVIPHHTDAVEGSQTVLKTTQDPELKAFLNNVIKTQGQEITMLKGYYKTWFGKEYTANSNYQAMIKFDGFTGTAIDKAYIQGMLGHHSSIIDVAKKVLAETKTQYKPEILTLSKQIIKDQEADNVVLQKWLDTKYQKVNLPQVESDGHIGDRH